MLGGSPGYVAFKLTYEISPIFLTGGIASAMGGGTLPLIALTQGSSFTSLISGGTEDDLDQFFAHFQPLPGSTLANQQIGTYPFANQAVAANAVIATPNRVSLLMRCPASAPGSYSQKQAILSALKATIDQHNNNGGTYVVNTPGLLYTDCLLRTITDTSDGSTKQAQFQWVWEFEKPLISLADAAAAQNNLMGKISSGAVIRPDASGNINWSGIDNTIGNPGSGAAGPLIPGNTPSGSLSNVNYNIESAPGSDIPSGIGSPSTDVFNLESPF